MTWLALLETDERSKTANAMCLNEESSLRAMIEIDEGTEKDISSIYYRKIYEVVANR